MSDEAIHEVPGEASAAPVSEREWWEDPALPWRHKPERADIACFSWISAVSVYSLVMMPLRPAILALSPIVVGALGYRTGLVMTGAHARLGNPWWPLVWVLGSLGAMKFDWVFWWAGRRWGRNLIEVWSGRSARARRANKRAEGLARRFGVLAVVLTYLPIPLPAPVIYAVVGEAGMSLRKFLVVTWIPAFVSTACYLAVGYLIGDPAVALMDTYGKYLWYFSLAMLVFVIGGSVWNQRRKAHPSDGVSSAAPDASLLVRGE
jgi:membrane protein DedA with SNARE-associated domain